MDQAEFERALARADSPEGLWAGNVDETMAARLVEAGLLFRDIDHYRVTDLGEQLARAFRG